MKYSSLPLVIWDKKKKETRVYKTCNNEIWDKLGRLFLLI